MGEASPLVITVTPKQLGRHLRDVRRKKGLSLSEVARGAGLSRRELVAYERGKVPIPESDLWVLAGSCGVDASELVPRTVVPELESGPTTMGETVAQLRRSQDDAGLAPYLATLNRLQALPPGKKVPVKERELEEIATALGREPEAIESQLTRLMNVSPAEAARLREIILPPIGGPHRPRAIEAAPQFTEMATAAPGAVDVFEELARLPEPIPLPDADAPLPDMFATPPPPEGAVELVDRVLPVGAAAGGFATAASTPPTGNPGPAPFESPEAVAWSAADAPPIDVALRQSSDAWADWGKVPAAAPIDARRNGLPSEAAHVADPTTFSPGGDDLATAWEPPPWQPGAGDGSSPTGPPSFWEGTDDWTPPGEGVGDGALPPTIDTPVDAPVDAPLLGGDGWTSNEWPQDLSGEDPLATGDEALTVDDWMPTAGAPSGPDDAGPWSHEPDPEAVSTGFYVDWGAPDDEPPAWHALMGPETGTDSTDTESMPWRDPESRNREGADPFFSDAVLPEPAPDVMDGAPDGGLDPSWDATWIDVTDGGRDAAFEDALPPIMWRADSHEAGASGELGSELSADADVNVDVDAPIIDGDDDESASRPAYVPYASHVEDFTVAGPDWQLGNALPLVEVRAQGALVMRRADERWALADLTTPTDCVIEVDVDFRSGPGLGVLFRAGVDDDGRMSGYSFDIDPIYDGGGYLVRQWQSDRELWNPIARVGASDPSSMYGTLTVCLELQGDHLTARVNGAEVLTVESLKQASADRSREAATGNRAGVQAWSSSDLVIETLRVAPL